MRLINTKTLQIQEFNTPKIPRYAILSHTWCNEELTFQDWLYVQNQTPPRWGWSQIPDEIERLKLTKGYIKVAKACEYARQHNSNCQWLWADTVCIDKTSSAELSEAINSMFGWYRRAEVCYAFLADVPPLSSEELAKCSYRTSPFRQSRWFRRGWTLQELVAPWSVVFLSRDWTPLGTRSTLSKHIATITSIPESCLSGNWPRIRDRASIAQKMSWAARRETTRIEDRAYCLIGLFEINMPLLYGEGEKAFYRLQQEIIKQTDDMSFLAWTSDRTQTFSRDHFIHWKLPPLAGSPSQFSSARKFVVKKKGEILASKRVFTANTGTFIHRPLLSTLSPKFVFAPLNVEVVTPPRPSTESVWIPLVKSGPSQGVTRSSFPTSTIVTALDASRCHMYKASPSETCLLPAFEASSARQYFREPKWESRSEINPRRQVGIMPVFATSSPWTSIADSYPPISKSSPVFTLNEAREHVYHGIVAFDGPHFIAHFIVIFSQASQKPLYWNVSRVIRFTEGSAVNATSPASPADLESLSLKFTEAILSWADCNTLTKLASLNTGTTILETGKSAAAAKIRVPDYHRFPSFNHNGSQYTIPPRVLNVFGKDAGPIPRETFRKRNAFIEMDNRWYTFGSGGSEDPSFVTHINLVMIGKDIIKDSKGAITV